jgi:DNA (cytosine-5)-methyltransferase 1
MLLGWKVVGCVEWDDYCQRLLRQRMEDGLIETAPIFGDIRTFISEGYARRYRGMVDVVSAGFPCQPFSVAGKQAGEDDPRNMWPSTIECIRVVRPRYAFLENVPGLLNSGYFGRVLGDLAESGYDARWRVLGADDVGAPHRRKRLWILAESTGNGLYSQELRELQGDNGQTQAGETDTPEVSRYGALGEVESGEQNVADTGSERLQGRSEHIRQEKERRSNAGHHRQEACSNGGNIEWWHTEPNVGRVANGVASRVDRLKAIGNGQVPAVVRAAWELLTQPYINKA